MPRRIYTKHIDKIAKNRISFVHLVCQPVDRKRQKCTYSKNQVQNVQNRQIPFLNKFTYGKIEIGCQNKYDKSRRKNKICQHYRF